MIGDWLTPAVHLRRPHDAPATCPDVIAAADKCNRLLDVAAQVFVQGPKALWQTVEVEDPSAGCNLLPRFRQQSRARIDQTYFHRCS
jgi:hypothetical protein